MSSLASTEPLSLCAGCGAALPVEGERCTVCGGREGEAKVRLAPSPTERWARVECRFRCVDCGGTSPVVSPTTSGGVECVHCGAEHRLDARVWPKVAALSHDVVDLAFCAPGVKGSSVLERDNPYTIVGRTVSDWSWSEPGVVAGREALSVHVAPGAPLCDRCHAPLSPRLTPAGLWLDCPSCGAHEQHAPVGALGYPALLAVACVEARTDAPPASSSLGSDGVTYVTCPHCGAPLTPDERSATNRCAHCQTTSIVSAKLWHRSGRRAPRLEPLWLLLSGRAPRRQQLEDRAAHVDPLELEIQARARAVLAREHGGSPLASALEPMAAPPMAPPAGRPPGPPAGPPPGPPGGPPPIAAPRVPPSVEPRAAPRSSAASSPAERRGLPWWLVLLGVGALTLVGAALLAAAVGFLWFSGVW